MDNVKYRLKVEALSDFLTFSFKTTVANSKIDWGDGTIETYSSTGSKSHTYASAGTYIIESDDVGFNGGSGSESNKHIKEIEIFQGVTSIDVFAFSDCNALTSLTLGSGVTSISYGAFKGCKVLTSLTLGGGVTSIGISAFSSCNALTSLVIPDNVTSIGNYAFNGCNALTSLTIPNSVTSIGNEAFNGCNALTSLTLGTGVTSIGDSTFKGCNVLTSLTLGSGVTSIGTSAFYNCNALTSLTIPDSVTTIGQTAFFKCNTLTSLTLGNGLTSIDNNAFYNGAFTSVNYTGTQAEWNELLPNIQDSKVKSVTVNFIATITYNSNGGSSVPSYTGSNYPDPLPVPVKEEYEFIGWFEESTFETPVVAGAEITLGSHTVYAKWEKNREYEIYQKTNDGIIKLKIKGDKIVPNSADPTTAKLTKLAINDTNFSLAGGGSSVYADYSTMITAMNAAAAGEFELGWNIYIRTVDVPDLWISKNDESTSVPYTYTTDAQFISDLEAAAATGLQVGFYRINKLETGKVFIPVEDVKLNGTSVVNNGVATLTRMAEMSFTCEMANGTTKTLKIYSELV